MYVYICPIHCASPRRKSNRKKEILKKGYRKKKYGIMPPSTALLRAGNRNLGAPALAPVFNK
jgi:hypothetical protein